MQDSSDDEIELPSLDVSKLSTIAKDDKTVKHKLEKAKLKPVRIHFRPTITTSLCDANPGFSVDSGPGCDLPRSNTSRVP
jgi:hypothetical protein